MSKYYVGDVGTVILLDTGSDLVAAGATVTNIIAKKPDGTEVTWTGVIYNDTYVKYTVLLGDWDQAGEWRLQAYVELPAWAGRGDTFSLKIHNHYN